MNKMAKSFNMSVTELQENLVKLIASNDIKARIDSHNKVCNYIVFNDNWKSIQNNFNIISLYLFFFFSFFHNYFYLYFSILFKIK